MLVDFQLKILGSFSLEFLLSFQELQRPQALRSKQDKLELEAKIQRLQDEAKPQRASDAITEENLDALQSRLQELHAAQLLTDDLMDAIMDTIADCIELLLMKNLQIV